MFMKRNAGKEIGTFSDPLPYPIIPIHFLEKSLENPSLFFAQNYNKMGRCMLGTGRFRGVPEDQEVCPWENQRHCLRTYRISISLILGCKNSLKCRIFATFYPILSNALKIGRKSGKSWRKVGRKSGRNQ